MVLGLDRVLLPPHPWRRHRGVACPVPASVGARVWGVLARAGGKLMAKGDEPRARHIHAQDLIRRRNEVTAVMAQLTDDWCHEIARRSRMSPGGDGYRSTSGSGSTHSGIGNPTEVTVLSQWIELKDQRTGLLTGEVMLRKPEPDPQQQAGERLRESLGAAYREANTMKRALSLIRFITDGRRGRET